MLYKCCALMRSDLLFGFIPKYAMRFLSYLRKYDIIRTNKTQLLLPIELNIYSGANSGILCMAITGILLLLQNSNVDIVDSVLESMAYGIKKTDFGSDKRTERSEASVMLLVGIRF